MLYDEPGKLPQLRETAWLVAYIDVTAVPPIVACVGLFSEEQPTSDLHRFRLVTLAVGRGRSFQDGIDQLWQEIAALPSRWRWIEPLLKRPGDAEMLGFHRLPPAAE